MLRKRTEEMLEPSRAEPMVRNHYGGSLLRQNDWNIKLSWILWALGTRFCGKG